MTQVESLHFGDSRNNDRSANNIPAQRRVIHRRNIRHSCNPADAIGHAPMEVNDAFNARIASFREVETDPAKIVGLKTHGQGFQAQEAVDQQPGADEEDHRERRFCDQQCGLESSRPARRGNCLFSGTLRRRCAIRTRPATGRE